MKTIQLKESVINLIVKKAADEVRADLFINKNINLNPRQMELLGGICAKNIQIDINYEKLKNAVLAEIPKPQDGRDGKDLLFTEAIRADVIEAVRQRLNPPSSPDNELAKQRFSELKNQIKADIMADKVVDNFQLSESVMDLIIEEIVQQSLFVTNKRFNDRLRELEGVIKLKNSKTVNSGISGQDMIEEITKILGEDWQLGGLVDSVDGRVGVVTLGDLYEPVIGAKGTAFNKNFGLASGDVAEGNTVIHTTGNETAAGEKTFSDKIAVGPDTDLDTAKLIEVRKYELSGAVINQENQDAPVTSAEELFPWQSFQPSEDGLLNKIAVKVNAPGPPTGIAGVFVEIYQGEGTGGTLLFSEGGHRFFGGENQRSISPPVAVLKDTLYTLQIRRAGVTVSWDRSGTNVYSRGRSNSDANHDRWFKIFLQQESLTSLVANTETENWGINKEEPEEALDVGGNIKADNVILPRRTETGNYTAVKGDYLIRFDIGASDYALTLDAAFWAAVPPGYMLELRKKGTGDLTITKGAGVVFVAAFGDVNHKIDGESYIFSVFVERDETTNTFLLTGSVKPV
jgi:hypothetical protein